MLDFVNCLVWKQHGASDRVHREQVRREQQSPPANGGQVTPPRISIIIPTYNRKDLLSVTLDSFVEQGSIDWECIVVDDHSDDGTLEMLAQRARTDHRIRVMVKPNGRLRGPASGRNVGLAESKADYVLFFDSDDLLEPGFLLETVRRMEENQFDLLVSRIRFFHPDGTKPDVESPLIQSESFIVRSAAAEHSVQTQNIVWKRSLLSKLDPIREDLVFGEDFEYAIRGILAADKIGIANDLFVKVRRHGDSLSFSLDRKKSIRRNLSTYDAHFLVVRSMARSGQDYQGCLKYNFRLMYNAVSGGIRSGWLNFGFLRRQLHLLIYSLRERQFRPFFRTLLLGPSFWLIGIARFISKTD
ncbi:MAG TPA: glycosyltransferase family 2 protein [Fibrobacteria bacterium]|nr:glycosyltransferase family 2 protein [Fibrobacteria bacterium]